ncbi:Hpt domain-containing protein [Steroidobacter sp. S1-65]|uniref:Hpt domain-containing protein n=1 Tax=Steroidobacter gossypii TaxID=2805490 RepID=A0ABS1WUP7_9GAMM|nr:Hpt domain-containing protein [Steroidobacter gossypii]MBM0104684.1 Hpt domain-containing protein [Steroidobacter gossypii]
MDQLKSGAASAIEPSAKVLDVDVLQDLLGSLGQPVAVAAIYSKFIANAAGFIRELSVLDAAARVETLHTLKGSAAMVGAERLAALAARLEPQSPVQVEQAIQALEIELKQFRAMVVAQFDALGAPIQSESI